MPVFVIDAITKKISSSLERSAQVALITDAADAGKLPADFLDAVDEVHAGGLNGWERYPDSADAVAVLLEGERLLSGDARSLRHHLLEPARRYYVPVHQPGAFSLDLIGIEPRWGRRNPVDELIAPHWRIAAGETPSDLFYRCLERQAASWARLSEALWIARGDTGQAIERLSRMIGESLPQWLLALVLRNLIVLLWKIGHWKEASTLLERGLRLFPSCSEFAYMAAVWQWSQKRAVEALRFAQQAIEVQKQHPGGAWVGSGGEGSYRAHWLMGAIADELGDHKSAFYNFLPGLRTVPPLPESVAGVLKQRVPAPVMHWLHFELRNVARRYPQYKESVVHFLEVNHHSASARLLQYPEGGSAAPLLHRRSASTASAIEATHPEIELAGAFFVAGPESRVVRSMARHLIQPDHAPWQLLLENDDFIVAVLHTEQDRVLLDPAFSRERNRLALTLRHHELPQLQRPSAGKLAISLYQPFSAVPRSWIQVIKRQVDKLLVPSEYVRQTLLRAGIADEKIALAPPLIDCGLYTPNGPKASRSSPIFTFLFPGQCSYAHGVDLLFDAWNRAFTASDPVELVICHDGSGSAAPGSLLEKARTRAAETTGPRVRCIDALLTDEKRAEMLRSADVVVLPFRMEASAQYALEAVACGTPVIASRIEPVQEVNGLLGDAALLVDGEMTPVLMSDRSEWIWNEPPLALEIHEEELANALKAAFARQDRMRVQAGLTAPAIQRRFSEQAGRELRTVIEQLL